MDLRTMKTVHPRVGADYELHEWVVAGELGALGWQASRCTGTSFVPYAALLMRFYHVVDGVAWMSEGMDIHSAVPTYEGQQPRTGCHLLEGPCYTDVSWTVGLEVFEVWRTSGMSDDVVFEVLSHKYRQWAEERGLGVDENRID